MSLKDRVSRAITRFFSPRADTQVALRDLGSYLVDAIESSSGTEGPRRVRIHRLDKDLPLPSRANPTDAGFDVYAAEDVTFKGGEVVLVSLGIIAEAPVGYHFKLYLRSSMAFKRGFALGNGVGIIDSSYSGPNDVMRAILRYQGTPRSTSHIKKGERIGQLILAKNIDIEWVEQEEQDFAGKDRGGFGSTGK